MEAVVHSSRLSGNVSVPPSKSHFQRACALGLLHPGKTLIRNPGRSNDDRIALQLIQELGATVLEQKDYIEISSDGQVKPAVDLYVGESGLSARMFTPIIALSDRPVRISGAGSLLKRPMPVFDEVLPILGIEFKSNAGFLPFQLQGPLHPSNLTVNGSGSSQYLTGILFAMASVAKKPVVITVNNLVSIPYIDMSLALLQQFGYQVAHTNYSEFMIQPSTTRTGTVDLTIEGDWSQAAFLLVAAVAAGDRVRLTGLQPGSCQGDKKILSILTDCFIQFELEEEAIIIEGPQTPEAFSADLTHCPDLFPPLVALASCCRGTSHLLGANRLINKESNRAEALIDVFSKMGISIKVMDDALIVTGSESVQGATVSSHGDHRIAMAAAIAGLRADKPVRIMQAEAIHKSYPDFFLDLQNFGANIHLED